MVDEIERLNRIMMNAPVIQKMIVRFLMTVLLSLFKKHEICQNAKLRASTAIDKPFQSPPFLSKLSNFQILLTHIWPFLKLFWVPLKNNFPFAHEEDSA